MAPSETTTVHRTVDWTSELAEQLDFHWRARLRPRLEGLTDAELHWEPVAGCWGIRPRSQATTPMAAEETLARLDEAYQAWMEPVRRLGPEELATPVGPAEGPWAPHPMAALVLHITREVVHHGAEVLVLRDLYRAGKGRIDG